MGGTHEAPEEAKDQEAKNSETDPAMPGDEGAAELTRDHCRQHQGHQQPMEEAGWQVPDPNPLFSHGLHPIPEALSPP